jgi:hypothetical protein|tara:strand:- start:10 stop:405 length:396 start_codon:yes stop_codon:yes gene_type:complete
MVARAPRKRMYRTMQGRMVDIEKLRAANESVQAVGNMNVNARGDVLGASGKIITSKAEVMKTYYERPKGMVDDTPLRSKPTPAVKPAPQKIIQKMTPTPQVVTPKATPIESVKPATSSAKKGIDAALDGLE